MHRTCCKVSSQQAVRWDAHGQHLIIVYGRQRFWICNPGNSTSKHHMLQCSDNKLLRGQSAQEYSPLLLFAALGEGFLGLLHDFVDAKEVLVVDGADGFGLVDPLCGTPVVRA